jgi:hypothetical protein
MPHASFSLGRKMVTSSLFCLHLNPQLRSHSTPLSDIQKGCDSNYRGLKSVYSWSYATDKEFVNANEYKSLESPHNARTVLKKHKVRSSAHSCFMFLCSLRANIAIRLSQIISSCLSWLQGSSPSINFHKNSIFMKKKQEKWKKPKSWRKNWVSEHIRQIENEASITERQ